MGGRALAADVQLERPLLRRARAELRAYCTRLQLPYVIDPTNVDLNYRRNAVRAALAPLRPAFPGLDLAVARCAAILRRDAQPPGGAAATLLREFLQQEPDTEAVSAERIESIVRFLDIGAGRRLRISLEANPNAKPTSSSRGEHTVTPYDEEA
jgi:tRNA(Ile)-lysidine synthase TilS/MesJ